MAIDQQIISHINWSTGLTTQKFLDEYWQKKPLLIRDALPGFKTPVSPDELAGMSLEEGTTPRIITQVANGQYQLEHGPFDENRYETIGNKDWSLLVTDCEKHWPELAEWIEPFRFLPRWRMDDLMISFAPDKASVGAHIDDYDVFLLQASGTRLWHIDASDNPDRSLVEDSTLRLLANFVATDSWELSAGDVLYLPPGVPHHGVAVGADCTTWSIGFRAPSNLDVLDVFSEILLDNLPLERFTDPPLKASNGAEIGRDAIEQLRRLWNTATQLSDEELVRLSGYLVTRGGIISADDSLSETSTLVNRVDEQILRWHSFTQVAYVLNGDSAELFVNGDAYTCSRNFAQSIADSQGRIELPSSLSKMDQEILSKILKSGALIDATDIAS